MGGRGREAALRRLLAAGAGLGGLAVAVLVGLSALPFEALEPRIDALAWDGEAEPFTPAFHAALVLRLRLAALLLAALALAVGLLRRPLSARAARVLEEIAASRRALHARLREAWRSDPPWHRAMLLAVLAVGFALRAAFLFHPLRRDEAFSFNNFISQPLPVALSNYAAYYGNNNHLLNTLLANLSCALFGPEPWAIRLPVLLAGAALVPVTYAAGRLLHGRRAGLLAASLVAVSPYLVARATDARGYVFVMLFAMAALALAAVSLRRSNAWAWTLFALATALGFYAVPTMLLAWGGIALWFAANAALRGDAARPLRDLALASAVAGALTLLLYAPVLAVSGLPALVDNHWVQPRAWSELAALWPERLAELGRIAVGDPLLPAMGALLTVGFAVGLVFHRRLAREPLPIWLPLLLWCALVVVVQRVAPWSRVWSFLLPLFLLTASAGLVYAVERALARRSALVPALALAFAALVWGPSAGLLLVSDRVYRDGDSGRVHALGEAAAFIEGELRAGDRVVADAAPGLVYELSARRVPPGRFLTPPGRERRLFVLAASAEEAEARIAEAEIPPAEFGAPELLARFPRYVPTAWFRMERVRAPAVAAAAPGG